MARVFPVRRGIGYGGFAGWLLALSPGMLPRTPLTVTVVATGFALIGLVIGACCAGLIGWIRHRPPPAMSRTDAVVCGGLAAVAVTAAASWEQQVRSAAGVAPAGPGWALLLVTVPTITALIAVAVTRRIWLTVMVVAAVVIASGAPAVAHATAAPAHRADLVYGALSPESFDRRADELVARWLGIGGADTRAVVIAVPTGSGWVDGAALTGIGEAFDDHASVLALQYDDVPSWRAYLGGSDAAAASGIALLGAVERALARAPQRPAIYLYGQSLGAIGADRTRLWAQRTGVEITGTVLAGPPAGSVDRTNTDPHRIVLINPSDPVADFAVELLWRPTHRPDTPDDPQARPRTPKLPWLPVVSFVGTGIDLLGALKVPRGHGHNYGTDQGTVMSRIS